MPPRNHFWPLMHAQINTTATKYRNVFVISLQCFAVLTQETWCSYPNPSLKQADMWLIDVKLLSKSTCAFSIHPHQNKKSICLKQTNRKTDGSPVQRSADWFWTGPMRRWLKTIFDPFVFNPWYGKDRTNHWVGQPNVGSFISQQLVLFIFSFHSIKQSSIFWNYTVQMYSRWD